MRVWFCVSKPYERKPDWLPVFEPPTSYAVIWMPGAWPMAAQMSRALGISVSSSLVKLVPMAVVDVSTTGEAPVTVTVSCRVAMFNCWSIVRVWLMTTRTSLRSTFWKPVRSNSIW